jgi:endonuclease I
MIPSRFIHTTILGFLFVAISFQLSGQIPAGYYDPASGKTGVALQSALHGIIKNHTVVSYTSIPGFFPQTDLKPGNVVWDMYSDVPGGTPPYTYHYNAGDECGNYNGEGDCYNREHSWPKSWFNDASPMYSDMFHIYPTDGYVNGMRSNYPYGTVGSSSWTSQNGSKLGNCNWPGYSGTVFEPINEYKGDFARTYFYMSTRYYTEDSGWNITDMTNKSQLKPWALQMMLHWHNTDPVSTKETNRNNAMYGIQHNRNPFIDHPEYAAMIWGNPVGTGNIQDEILTVTVYPNPVSDFCRISISGENGSTLPEVKLISIDGKEMRPVVTMEDQGMKIDLRSFADGFYIMVISGTEFNYRSRIVKRCSR